MITQRRVCNKHFAHTVLGAAITLSFIVLPVSTLALEQYFRSGAQTLSGSAFLRPVTVPL